MLKTMLRLAVIGTLCWLAVRYLGALLRGADTPQMARSLPPELPRSAPPVMPLAAPKEAPIAETPAEVEAPPIIEAAPEAIVAPGLEAEPETPFAPVEAPEAVVAPGLEEPATPSEAPQAPAEALTQADTAPDDLTQVEGIGPKSAAVLHEAGITTFVRLAAADPQQLRELLQAAGLRLPHPDTWPEQAGFLAAGDLDGFKRLTAELKGGRRVQATPSDES